MAEISTLPIYNEDDPDQFIKELREHLRMNQSAVARHFKFNRVRVSEYENGKTPPLGYLTGLASLIAEKRKNDPEVQDQLLQEINRAIRRYGTQSFHDWDELASTAHAYLVSQSEKKQRSKSKPKNKVTAPEPPPTEWQVQVEERLSRQIYTKLYGPVDSYLEEAKNYLTVSSHQRLIAIVGAGGLGKTTLAEQIVRQPEMGQHFQQFAWVSAKQVEFRPSTGIRALAEASLDSLGVVDALVEQFQLAESATLPPRQKEKALIQYLRKSPALIVVDNLETVAEIDDLIPLLRSLAGPSKILITSRHELPNEADVAHIRLKPLSQPDTLLFCQHLAELYDLADVASATEQQWQEIYQLVGGNPLAIRLVIGQIGTLSLPDVLENLAQAPDEDVDVLYDYLFEQSRTLLKPESNSLFTLMSQVDKATTAQLAAISQLERSALNRALRHLVTLSLIEKGGTLDKRRYHLHPLTQTFLLKTAGQERLASSDKPDQIVSAFSLGLQRNLGYWQAWLDPNIDAIAALDLEREGILRAIRLGLEDEHTWLPAIELSKHFTGYMERRGYWDIWNQVLNRAIEVAKQQNDILQLTNLTSTLARLLRRQSRYGEAASTFLAAIRLACKAADPFNEARSYSNLGHLYIVSGHWWRAEVLCNRALIIFSELDNAHGLAHTHNHLGMLYTDQGEWEKAYQHLENACEVWSTNNDHYGLMLGLNNLGKLMNNMHIIDLEPPLDAMTYFELSLSHAISFGDKIVTGSIYTNMAIAHRLNGRFSEAQIKLQEAEAIFQEFSDIYNLTHILEGFGQLYIVQERWCECERYLGDALKSWRILKEIYGETRVMIYLLEYELARGNIDSARWWLQCVDEIFQKYKITERYQWYHTRLKMLRHSLNKAT